jgi:hypothetical protein
LFYWIKKAIIIIIVKDLISLLHYKKEIKNTGTELKEE